MLKHTTFSYGLTSTECLWLLLRVHHRFLANKTTLQPKFSTSQPITCDSYESARVCGDVWITCSWATASAACEAIHNSAATVARCSQVFVVNIMKRRLSFIWIHIICLKISYTLGKTNLRRHVHPSTFKPLMRNYDDHIPDCAITRMHRCGRGRLVDKDWHVDQSQNRFQSARPTSQSYFTSLS